MSNIYCGTTTSMHQGNVCNAAYLSASCDFGEGDQALCAVDEVFVANLNGQQLGISEERQAVVCGEVCFAFFVGLDNGLVRLVHTQMNLSQLSVVVLSIKHWYQQFEHLQSLQWKRMNE